MLQSRCCNSTDNHHFAALCDFVLSLDTSIKWTSSTFVALRHGRPLPPPITLANQAYTSKYHLIPELLFYTVKIMYHH